MNPYTFDIIEANIIDHTPRSNTKINNKDIAIKPIEVINEE